MTRLLYYKSESYLNILVDGGWGQWRAVGPCSKPCHGLQGRVRLCDSPARKNGGRHCAGKPYEEKPCHQLPEESCINGKG